jgi:hypothetical protein
MLHQVKKTVAVIIGVSAITLLPSDFTFANTLVEDVGKAFTEGDVALNLRYRYETVDQDGIPDDATASTLRSRLTLTSGKVGGLQALIEVDNVSYTGGEAFNNTNNGKTHYPVVADPDYTEVNQAFLSYAFDVNNKASVGRQRIVHSGQRFLGNVGWRQNEQTFDAVRINLTPVEGLSLDYSYIWNVNRIFDPDTSIADFEGDNHAFIGSYQVATDHRISAFAYLIDLDGVAGPALSSTTYGLAYKGSFKISDDVSVNVDLSYAKQDDYRDNPTNYHANYYLGELAAKFKPLTVAIGYEVLGSDDGITGFSTPLATGHKFQGFADKFLATPAGGIEDSYLKLTTKVCNISLTAYYHDFESEYGSMDYGSEFDFVAAYKFATNYSILFKYAAYNADEFATDTDKGWLMLTAAF